MRSTISPRYFLFMPFILVGLIACRQVDPLVPSEVEDIEEARPAGEVCGFYLVNEGNMGSNKCTLDYMDYETGKYIRNIYAERNPDVVKELGDVGNDIQIYGSKLYIVVNCSHKVEVLDAYTAKRIGQVDIPNCRYIRFSKGRAYVSSYVAPVQIDPKAPRGAVFTIDTTTLQLVGSPITVGYQPEEMVIIKDRLYVANSGGYRTPNYDNTISEIDLKTMRELRQIPVGINLHRLRRDKEGRLWVNSRGNYRDVHSNLFVLTPNPNTHQMEVTDTLDIPCANFAIRGDSLYYYSSEFSEETQDTSITYGVINMRTKQRVSTNFITDGTERNIVMPYYVTIHPVTGDILLTDAGNYVSSGKLYCFSPEGKLRWSTRTGDIPSGIAFLYH